MIQKKSDAFFLSIVVFILISVHVYGQPPDQSYQLLFEDNFKGKAVNENDWRYRLGPRVGVNINGLGRKENVFVSDQGLHIAVKQEMIDGKLENTGGGVISKHQFGYGYYETLSKPFMAGTGVHSAFWQAGGAVPNNSIFEIDSYEIDSKYKMGCNNLYIHISSKQYGEVPWIHRANLPFEFRPDGWFLDAYEYTPEGVTFYENGKVVAHAEWQELTAAQVVWLSALNGVGKVEDSKQPGETIFKYFRYYAKAYPGINLLPNGDFEYNMDKIAQDKPIAWQIEGNNQCISLPEADSKVGKYHLKIGNTANESNVKLFQTLEYILNDTYTLSAWVKAPRISSNAKIVISELGQKDIEIKLPASNDWKKLVVPNINVKNNTVKIAVYGVALKGQTIEIDDIRFFKPDVKKGGAQVSSTKMFDGSPAWQIAQKYPIDFKDDRAFYFFDRNVGLGDAATIHFEFTADKLANTVPLARMPKLGSSGWAIRLTDSGDVAFSLGSMASHGDVVVKNAYQANKKTSVTCTYNKGDVTVYIDGVLAEKKRVEGFDMNDKSAAGKMGNTGTIFEAVGEVMAPSADKPTAKGLNAFKGRIQNVQIYNEVLGQKELMLLGK